VAPDGKIMGRWRINHHAPVRPVAGLFESFLVAGLGELMDNLVHTRLVSAGGAIGAKVQAVNDPLGNVSPTVVQSGKILQLTLSRLRCTSSTPG
jgi:aminoglycoside N3'-acetyltransferase